METHEVPDTLDAVVAAFRGARGDEADADWARSAAARFALDGVRPVLARRVLGALVPTVEQSREPARDLFGDPVAWARERQDAWRTEGVAAEGPAGPTSVRGFVHDLLVGAAVVAVVMTPLRMLVDGWKYELDGALLLFPALMSAGILGQQRVWSAAQGRFPRLMAVAVAAGSFILFAAAVVGVFLVAARVSLGEVSGFWLLGVATGYGVAASVVGRFWPAPEAPEPVELVASDENWSRALTARLRQRGDFTDARARAVVAEAEAHVQDTGRTLHQEFGSPRSYAARFAPDHVVRARRTAWTWTAASLAPVLLLLTYLLEDGWSWQSRFVGLGLWFASAAAVGAHSWRRVAVLRSRQR